MQPTPSPIRSRTSLYFFSTVDGSSSFNSELALIGIRRSQMVSTLSMVMDTGFPVLPSVLVITPREGYLY